MTTTALGRTSGLGVTARTYEDGLRDGLDDAIRMLTTIATATWMQNVREIENNDPEFDWDLAHRASWARSCETAIETVGQQVADHAHLHLRRRALDAAADLAVRGFTLKHRADGQWVLDTLAEEN